jgi:hypothetical protein
MVAHHSDRTRDINGPRDVPLIRTAATPVVHLVVVLDGDVWNNSRGLPAAVARCKAPNTVFALAPTPDREILAAELTCDLPDRFRMVITGYWLFWLRQNYDVCDDSGLGELASWLWESPSTLLIGFRFPPRGSR